MKDSDGWTLLANKVIGLALEDLSGKGRYVSSSARLFLIGNGVWAKAREAWLSMASPCVALEAEKAKALLLAGKFKPFDFQAAKEKLASRKRLSALAAAERGRRRRADVGRRDKILRANCKTKTARELAAMLGTSSNNVYLRLRKLGLKCKPVSNEERVRKIKLAWAERTRR